MSDSDVRMGYLQVRMDVKGNPIGRVHPCDVDFNPTFEHFFLYEWLDLETVAGRADFLRESRLADH